MAEGHPYMSGGGAVLQIVEHLRRTFPAALTADTLKKLGVAPNNESYLINILRFVGVIDDEGKKTPAATKVFSKHDDAEFAKAFGDLVKDAYKDLFSLHGDKTWDLDQNKLISFFRQADESSAVVGQRQATTFLTLAALSGHGEGPKVRATKSNGGKPAKAPRKPKAVTRSDDGASDRRVDDSASAQSVAMDGSNAGSRDVGLTVRIEINLPAAGDQETYDRIFKSIRENLLNAK
jgi:hypothetical protein